MSNKKMLMLVGVLMAAAFVLTACAGPAGPEGPAGPAGPAGAAGAAGAPAMTADLTCSECHNDGGFMAGKVFAWETSSHGSGTSAAYAGARDGCAGCHSGSAFSSMVAAGLVAPADVVGAENPVTRQDCRACHAIHTTYTSADWALETTAPVELYKQGATYDGGMGNLCVICHEVRAVFTPSTDGNVTITSSRYGPHYGPMSSLILGTGGAGLEGSPSAHYTMVENTCVGCHLGEGDDHSFLPKVSACVACHADATSLDINGVRTEIEAKLDEVHAKLLEMKLLNPDTDLWGIYDPATEKFSNPSADKPLVVTEAVGNAMWNYKMVYYDKSMGVHNPDYTLALLESALAALP